MGKYRVVHYLNQFFAQIGGEEEVNIPPMIKEGAIGPGRVLQQALGEEWEIVATVICGDSYFAENIEEASAKVVDLVSSYQPDVFVAGPAFNAGRYGVACGASCSAISKKLGIPVITGMYKENPGLDLYRKELYIVPTSNSARKMKDDIPAIASLLRKLGTGQEIGSPQEEGYFPRGLRVNRFVEQTGAERAVDMLLLKLKGEPFQTEYSMPTFERIPPSSPLGELSSATIALVTSGGIVPRGNPDRIESASASKFAGYDIAGLDCLPSSDYETVHGGYDPVYANDCPDRVLPLDAMRALEKDGTIGKLYHRYYVTVGNATSVSDSEKFGEKIALELKSAGVHGVILTSTWGTDTRCGATLVKEIDRAGLPVAHVAAIVPISLTVGANRIVPAVAIPYPLGNPALSKDDERQLRLNLVKKALAALQTEVECQTVF